MLPLRKYVSPFGRSTTIHGETQMRKELPIPGKKDRKFMAPACRNRVMRSEGGVSGEGVDEFLDVCQLPDEEKT